MFYFPIVFHTKLSSLLSDVLNTEALHVNKSWRHFCLFNDGDMRRVELLFAVRVVDSSADGRGTKRRQAWKLFPSRSCDNSRLRAKFE